MAVTTNVRFNEEKFKQYIAEKAADILQDYYDGKTFTISGSNNTWWDDQRKDENGNPLGNRYSASQVLRYSATTSADANGVITVTIKPELIIQVTQIQ